MYIHIGKKDIISDKKLIGVFNYATIEKSEINSVYLDECKEDTKTIIIDSDDEVIVSNIGSSTIVKRIKDTKERGKKLSTLEMTLDEIEDNEKEILEIENALKTKKKKLKIFLEKQCPLCGRAEK